MNFEELMKKMLSEMSVKDLLSLNSSLQKKKNQLRQDLFEKGILKKEGENKYDNYAYFSEAQYKILFTELFSKNNLELKFDEVAYETFELEGKQKNGRMPKIKFTLFDIETGFFETTEITSEGIDKGDKAGYKAYTGALKYYLANTFMVATGDDAEKESPEAKGIEKKATEKQINILEGCYEGENLEKLLKINKIEKLEDLSMAKASELIKKIFEKRGA